MPIPRNVPLAHGTLAHPAAGAGLGGLAATTRTPTRRSKSLPTGVRVFAKGTGPPPRPAGDTARLAGLLGRPRADP